MQVKKCCNISIRNEFNCFACPYIIGTYIIKKRGLILYRGTICGLTEITPFLYRYFKVLGQKISC